MDTHTKNAYKEIINQLISCLENEFSKTLSSEQIEFIKLNWTKHLQESGIYNLDSKQNTLQSMRMLSENRLSFQRAIQESVAEDRTQKMQAFEPKVEPKQIKDESSSSANAISKSTSERVVEKKAPLEPIEEEEDPEDKLKKKVEIKIELKEENDELLKKRESFSEIEDDEDDELFGGIKEKHSGKRVKEAIPNEVARKREQDQKIMKQLVEEAIRNKPAEEAKVEKPIQDEEALNSDDDVVEYRMDAFTGNNKLIGYFDKASRKRDKRKINFQNCILRVDDVELILPFAKGDFIWEGNKHGQF